MFCFNIVSTRFVGDVKSLSYMCQKANFVPRIITRVEFAKNIICSFYKFCARFVRTCPDFNVKEIIVCKRYLLLCGYFFIVYLMAAF